jgi:hypothetical protein
MEYQESNVLLEPESQTQLPWEFVLTTGYAGSRGIHLWRNTDINIPAPEVLADGTQFWAPGLPRPNRSFGTVELKRGDGNSWYNAMIVEVRRRWARLLRASSYTWGAISATGLHLLLHATT